MERLHAVSFKSVLVPRGQDMEDRKKQKRKRDMRMNSSGQSEKNEPERIPDLIIVSSREVFILRCESDIEWPLQGVKD